MLPSLRGRLTPREGAGRLPVLLPDLGSLPYPLPAALLGRNVSPHKAAVGPGKGMHDLVSEATPYHHVLRTELRDLVGFLADREREVLALRPTLRRPHRDPYMPGLVGTQGARLADNPLAREMVLVRGGHRSAARGTPGCRGAQRRGRCGRPVTDLHLPDYLSHGVRGAHGQPCGRASGR